MLKYCVILTLSLNSFFSNSQITTNEVVPKLTLSLEKQEAKKEQSISLEEQGFQKIVLNDIIIYRKEVNGIIVEFIPEKK